MADPFGEDLFAVFEDGESPEKRKRHKKDDAVVDPASTSAEKLAPGEQRDFKPDVGDVDLDESVPSKKSKVDDSQR